MLNQKWLQFFRDERNYPQFFNSKARRLVASAIIGVLLLPALVLIVTMYGALISNRFANQETLANWLIIAGAFQIIFVFLFVIPVFSRGNEKMIFDAEELLRVAREAKDDIIGSRDSGIEMLRYVTARIESDWNELVRQNRGWRDVEVIHLRWKDLSAWKKAGEIAWVALSLIMLYQGAILMFGLSPRHPKNPSLELTPNGRIANAFMSGEYDFWIGLSFVLASIAIGFMLPVMSRTVYRSKSGEALKQFMKEMGI